MKVKPLHIFIGLVIGLCLCTYLGYCVKEGLQQKGDDSQKDQAPYSTYRNELDRENRARDLMKAVNQLKAETATGDPALLSEDDSPKTKLVTGPKGEKVMATHQNTVLGVPKHKIPEGQEDLYILKSEVVPPVCPACPSGSVCPREKPCPPCPPCARCPEPAFECQKVPNYRADGPYVPRPVLTDFSQFGM